MAENTVRSILEMKGDMIWTVSPDATVYDALTLMAKKDIGALLAMENEKMIGIITERDYARKVILRGRTSRDTRVSEIMTSPVFTIHPDQTLDEAMEMMISKRVRHLPVSEDNQHILGIISVRDLLQCTIYYQRDLIKRMEDSIKTQNEKIAQLEECMGIKGEFIQKYERLRP